MANEREISTAGGTRPAATPQEKTKKKRRKEIKLTPREKRETGEGRVPTNWRYLFIEALAETSDVELSVQRAGTVALRAYKVRRRDPAFAARWQAALDEGYQNLEMDALGYLRAPKPTRKFDIVAALRMLAARAAKLARKPGEDEADDEPSLLESIDAMIDEIRERRAANAEIIARAAGKADDGAL